MATWSESIENALNNLDGTATYEEIYSEVKVNRKNLPKSWKQIIQRTIQDKSSDSEGFKGNEDLFYAVNGLGSGVWGLRSAYLEKQLQKLDLTNLTKKPNSFDEYQEQFQEKVIKSTRDKKSLRLDRLKSANAIPDKINTTITIFSRNPDIVVETLSRAKGICEICKNPAPFIRAKDGTPFLEVHHIKQLAHGGEDTLENTLALCPNCHREQHYG